LDLTVSGLDDGQASIHALTVEKTALQTQLGVLQTALALLTPGTTAHTAKQAEIDAKDAEIDAKQDEIDNGRANYSNFKVPLGHKLIKELRTFVNNQQVSGKCGDMDILYNALVKASVGEDWVNSRMNEHAKELIDSADDLILLSLLFSLFKFI
jgi:hypothetical protein